MSEATNSGARMSKATNSGARMSEATNSGARTKTSIQKRFQKINIEISNICNLQCSFCPEVIREKGMMSEEMFRNIIRQAAPITEQVCLHLMGDPLVHPKLENFIAICEEFGVRIFFVTNGVLLRDKQADLLLRPALRQVNFSLHSFHDNFGDKDPTLYLDKIFHFTERAFAERPDLYLNYRLWNLGNTDGFSGKTQDKNLQMLERIEARFGVKIDREIDVKIQKSRLIKNRLYLHFDTEFTWPSMDLPVLGTSGFCHGLSSHFGILVDGTVVPCCLDKEAVISLGNVKDATLNSILESPRALAIYKGFRERKLVEALCSRCPYIERFN